MSLIEREVWLESLIKTFAKRRLAELAVGRGPRPPSLVLALDAASRLV
ncbi:MAG: hypothetical protein N3H31_05605 [Candidatus Nezhaarchaeota archaeon]|nr:hypothetical protein [Candidatus Nezhaarchaeota archaeon]